MLCGAHLLEPFCSQRDRPPTKEMDPQIPGRLDLKDAYLVGCPEDTLPHERNTVKKGRAGLNGPRTIGCL